MTRVQARHHGRLFHAGKVADIARELGLFWIMDTVSGGRKLLDMTDLEIVRMTKAALPDNPKVERPTA